MTTKTANWAPELDQITKSRLSDGRRAKFLPPGPELIYSWLRFEEYMGNVSLKNLRNPGVFSDTGLQTAENKGRQAMFPAFYASSRKLVNKLAETKSYVILRGICLYFLIF